MLRISWRCVRTPHEENHSAPGDFEISRPFAFAIELALMRSVRIPALDRPVSSIGFGCASIMGRVDKKTSLAALAQALDSGVDYFDVARSYGYGRAEEVLGEFLKGNRDRCVVATKTGIAPSFPGFVSRVLLPAARKVVSRVPSMRKLSALRGQKLAGVSMGNFDPSQVVESLETSLRELETDYVDVLLLHEVADSDLENQELLRCLEDLVRSGKARALGTATNAAESARILERQTGISVIQVQNRMGETDASVLEGKSVPFLITHSPMVLDQDGRGRLAAWLNQHPEKMLPLRDAGLAESSPEEAIPEILLGWAIAANPTGLTLSGMLQPEHVVANLETAAKAETCRDALLALGMAWRAHSARAS